MKKEQRKILEAQAAEQERKILEYQLRTGHARPRTRREFLQAGLISFSGYMIAPSFIEMFLRSIPAYAADCGGGAAAATSGLVPVVTVNLSGGWGAAANILMRDLNGQMLPSYSQLGSGRVPTGTSNAFSNNQVFTESATNRGFLAGIRSAATADTISKTACVAIGASTNDDNDNVRLDISGMLIAAGLKGQKLGGLGETDSNTGIGKKPALNKIPLQPLRVGRINDILNALGSAGALATGLNATQQKSVLVSLMKTIKNLSDSQARDLASVSGGTKVLDLVGCATQQNLDNANQGAGTVDPRTNATLATNNTTSVNGADGTPLWNFGDGRQLARAAMAMNAINGMCSAVGFELGDYDYHGNDRAETDSRDRDAGRVVGQVLQTAALLQKRVMVYVVTDGAVVYDTSDNAGTKANGDSGDRSVQLVFAYNPTTAQQAKSSQIGGFTTGQAANTSFVSGWNADKVGAAVFANWAVLSNQTGLIQQVIPNVLSADDMNKLIVF